ncbi:MAG: nucleoside deaminase [Anaerolineae bacterium]|nr:nucleoside deaminase [Anaerolineae bacterium]
MEEKQMPNEQVYRMMRDLIQYTRERALEYKTFTGAYIVKGTEIIWCDITSVEKDRNPLAHAELKAIQGALSIMGESLATCVLFTTQQPCPMCASAIAWSGIEAVYYGVPTSHQWRYPEEMRDFLTHLGVRCIGPILENECKAIDDFLLANGI